MWRGIFAAIASRIQDAVDERLFFLALGIEAARFADLLEYVPFEFRCDELFELGLLVRSHHVTQLIERQLTSWAQIEGLGYLAQLHLAKDRQDLALKRHRFPALVTCT